MATVRNRVRERPIETAVAITVVAYALVIGTFVLDLPYPPLSEETVLAMNHAIAAINTTTVVLLALGWYWIRQNDVEKHRLAMLGAFALILLFLVIYLLRVGGGGERYIDEVTMLVQTVYRAMLAIHILLSIVAVPLVVYALILGLTHTPAELRQTNHARVGRVAAGAWLLSLALGVITYVMLDHLYDYEFAAALVSLL